MNGGESGGQSGALVVMTRGGSGSVGPVATWMTASGWAKAIRDRFGAVWFVTPDGELTPEDALALASSPGSVTKPRKWARYLPSVLKTAIKDVIDFRAARRFARTVTPARWANHDLRFVWQRHDLFCSVGRDLADALEVPLVLFVDAPVVWEARRWGVKRPIWGRLIERLDEDRAFRSADVVACVSPQVAEEIGSRGVPAERIVVTPCGVDLEMFAPDPHLGAEVRAEHDLEDRLVVGWIGSFRRFHGLELVLEGVAELADAGSPVTLLLVGDGQERPHIEDKVEELGLDGVVFTGTIDYEKVPAHILAMDVALVSAGGGEFHYSPLKLREYMACARPVVAPSLGEMATVITDGVDGILVEPGSSSSLADAIRRLAEDEELRKRVGSAARETALRDSSWQVQLRKVEDRLSQIESSEVASSMGVG